MPSITETNERIHAAYEYGRCIGGFDGTRITLDFVKRLLRDSDTVDEVRAGLTAGEHVHREVLGDVIERHETDPFVAELRASLKAAELSAWDEEETQS